MNKDALLATAIGFFIGLCITGILLAGPSILKLLPHMNVSMPTLPKSKSNATPTPKIAGQNSALSIDSPLPDAIESEDELLVSGVTAAKALVVLQGLTDDVVVQAGEDGKYAGKLSLTEGRNTIVVTSYDKTKQTKKDVTVFYTQESL